MEKSFWIFQNGGFFQIVNFDWQINVFAITGCFCNQIWKILVPTESSSEKDAKRCKHMFCSSSGSEDIREKQKVEKQGDVFFCYRLYIVSTLHFINLANYQPCNLSTLQLMKLTIYQPCSFAKLILASSFTTLHTLFLTVLSLVLNA